MKLWLKISILCVIVLLAVVATCSTLLLLQSRNSILELTTTETKDKQRSLRNAFASMASYYIGEDTGKAAEYSVIMYCFSQFADETGVLVSGGQTLISQTRIQPEAIIPLEDLSARPEEQRVYSGELEGRNILIVGSETYIGGQMYSIYVVQDVSTVYNDISRMAWRFALISAVGVIIGTVFIMLLVRRASKPLGQLGATARQIAGGDYAKRAHLRARDEVGLLAEDFDRMADAVEAHIKELMEIAQRQRLFIGGVTHEFKTPLTAMMIHSETLINARMSEAERERSLHHIHEQCAWLERLTQKLLKLITLSEGITLRLEPVKALFDAVYESTEETLTQRGTLLVTQCDMDALSMDVDMMRSLLVNLVDNASKASKAGQQVLLYAYGNVIEVRDFGCGIPKEELARVVEPFYMGDRSRSKRMGGSGLGLALAKRIVEAHGARLEIESTPGQGTRICVVFARWIGRAPITNR